MGSTALKHCLIDHVEPAYKVAMKMGISEVRLSKITNRLIKAKPEERKKLSKILNKSENELFPPEEG